METKFTAPCEVIYLKVVRYEAKSWKKANEKAFDILKEHEDRDLFPMYVGNKHHMYFGDIRIDNVEEEGNGTFSVTLNVQYVGDFNVKAENAMEGSIIADEMLKEEKIITEFDGFELDMKHIYDIAPYEWI